MRESKDRELPARLCGGLALLALGLVSGAVSARAQDCDSDDVSPVAHWTFDAGTGASAADSSIFGNDATLQLGAGWTAGHTGGSGDFAVDLDGVNDHLNAGSGAILDNLSTLTYTAWIYPSADGDREIFSKRNSTHELRLRNTGTLRGCIIASGADACSDSTPAAVPLFEWTHVAMTYDHGGDRKVHLYVDGEEVAYTVQTVASGTLTGDASASQLLGRRANKSRPFAGAFDEMRIYNTVLDLCRIAELAEVGCSVDADCDDGAHCNGAEICNVGTGECEAGTPPACDDGAFCNGSETCNEDTDMCDAGTPPDCADGVFCNGDEVCNEETDGCDAGPPTICDDGVDCTFDFCNGATDSCDATPIDCGDIGIFLLPSQDTTGSGEPHQAIYNDAALVWPVAGIIYRVLPLPDFAGGVDSPSSIADTMEAYVDDLKAQGVQKFIFPASTSVMRLWLAGDTEAMGEVAYAERHPSIVGATFGSVGNSAGDYGTAGNLFVFTDYLSSSSDFSLRCVIRSIPTAGLVYILYEDLSGANGDFLRSLAWDRKSSLEAAGLVVEMFAVGQTGLDPGDPFDFSSVTKYVGAGPDGGEVGVEGLDMATEIAANTPDAIDSGWYFSGPTADSFVRSAKEHGGILLGGIFHFGWYSETELIPVDVSYGCSTIPVLNGLNEESLKVGFPTTNCAWDSGEERASLAGYSLVEMFAFLATDLEYRGPENMLRFRANGVRIDPYLIGGRGLVRLADTFESKKDRILRNPIWEDDTVGLDVVDLDGPFDQSFGFCSDPGAW